MDIFSRVSAFSQISIDLLEICKISYCKKTENILRKNYILTADFTLKKVVLRSSGKKLECFDLQNGHDERLSVRRFGLARV